VLKVTDVNKLIVPVSENNEIKYYVHNEELFDVIHNIHLSIGHGERNRMEYEVNTKYKNISRDMIMQYLIANRVKKKRMHSQERIGGATNYINKDELINNINTCH
jgi:hypothetical protein